MVLHGYVEETTLYPIQYYANITLAQFFYEKQAATIYLVPVFLPTIPSSFGREHDRYQKCIGAFSRTI